MAQARTTTRSSDARIGSAARVRGRIQGEGDLVIEGHVEGDVSLRGDLTVASGASLRGDNVEAQALTVAGELQADVTATGPVRIESGARVRGDIGGPSVSIADGARFSGHLACEFDLPPELGGASPAPSRGRAAARR